MSEPASLECRAVTDGAFEFARDQLWLARELEPMLSPSLTSDRWKATTFADPAVSDERLSRFAEGGRVASCDPIPATLSVVRDAMTRDAPANWLLPDPVASPDDPHLDTPHTRQFSVGGTVYYIEPTPDIELLRAAWRNASSAGGQMGLATTHELPYPSVTEPDLKAAVDSAVVLVFTAYDGDGVLLFSAR